MLVQGDRPQEIRALPFVTWANTYLRGFKINPALLSAPEPTARRSLLAVHAAPDTLARTPFRVDIVLHRGAKPAAVRRKIAAAAGRDLDNIAIEGNKVRPSVPARALPKLAEIDEVRSIERVSPKKLQNNVARTILRVGVPSPTRPCSKATARWSRSPTPASTRARHQRAPGFQESCEKALRPRADPERKTTRTARHPCRRFGARQRRVRHVGGLKGAARHPKAELVLQSVLDSSGGLGGLPADLRTLFDKPVHHRQGEGALQLLGQRRTGVGQYDSAAPPRSTTWSGTTGIW